MDTCIYKETLLQLCQPLKQVAYEEAELSLRASQKFITGDVFITYAEYRCPYVNYHRRTW